MFILRRNSTRKLQNKGITLIALIITIIILLILAGVTINFVLGENGILNNTKRAANKYNQEQEKEKNDLEEMDKIFSSILVADDSNVNISMDKLNEYINKKVKEENAKLEERISILENETIRNTKTVLKNTPTEIPMSTNTQDVRVDIPLNLGGAEKLKDYKYIEIQSDLHTSSNGYAFEKTYIMSTDQLKFNSGNTELEDGSQFSILLFHGAQTRPTFMNCYFKNDTTLHIWRTMAGSDNFTGVRIRAIYGIK